MSKLIIEGGFPLEGDVTPSGSNDSALKLIIGALFSNEEVLLDNISKTYLTDLLLPIIESLGARVEWIAKNRLLINASSIHTHVVPYALGSKLRLSSMLAGPLLYRFGKAVIPKPQNTLVPASPINRWIDTWKSLGIEVSTNETEIILESKEIVGSTINFKISTHNGTANAILSSIFAAGETTINNAAEEDEINDLIEFLIRLGANIERPEPRRIKITGTNVFGSAQFFAQPDKIETIAYATAALVTKGNLTIKDIGQLELTSFLNFLTKIGARYEYSKPNLNVWYGGEDLSSTTQSAAPSPGFLADWLPFAALLLNFADGESLLHDTIYIDRLGFITDLNRMGASMELVRPSTVSLQGVISDESYDYESLGEPYTVIKINGPKKLKGVRLNLNDYRYDTLLVLAALSAEGKSEISGIENMQVRHEGLFDKFNNLGAHIN